MGEWNAAAALARWFRGSERGLAARVTAEDSVAMAADGGSLFLSVTKKNDAAWLVWWLTITQIALSFAHFFSVILKKNHE